MTLYQQNKEYDFSEIASNLNKNFKVIIEKTIFNSDYFMELITEYRKQSDIKKEIKYITTIRYLDLIDKPSYSDNEDVYDIYGNVLYSSWHKNDNCDNCKKYIQNLKKNSLIGMIIYPSGVIPPKRDWTIFGKRK